MIRDTIFERLNEDIVGPLRDDESLEFRPSDVYLTGILFPISQKLGEIDDDENVGNVVDSSFDDKVSLLGQSRPSSFGISYISSNLESHLLDIEFAFGQYTLMQENQSRLVWRRRQFRINCSVEISPDSAFETRMELPHELDFLNISTYIRTSAGSNGLLVTVTVLNRSTVAAELGSFEREKAAEERTLFQTDFRIRKNDSFEFMQRPNLTSASNDDELSQKLLYRQVEDYCVGHQSSASWDTERGQVTCVKTNWLPSSIVKSYSSRGGSVFDDIVESGKLNARWLSAASCEELFPALQMLTDSYSEWIDIQEQTAQSLDEEFLSAAVRHIGECRAVQARMNQGVDALSRNDTLLKAFRFANSAIALQHSWKEPERGFNWRPFQLGFILLSLESITNPASEFRETFDLLWFPTGGGKTETYLGLIALASSYRKFCANNRASEAGCVAVMRYTLRLLTIQQFERAAALILACEVLRSEINARLKIGERGIESEFSIGLWVGSESTPNSVAGFASGKVRGNATPDQIRRCPCCKRKLTWALIGSPASKYRPRCTNDACVIAEKIGIWPVMTIDDDLYQSCPTLVIGTIDKFAQLSFESRAATMFGFGTNLTPDMVIQDELHLISGPLGSIAGAYEVAFDWLMSTNNQRPKVIGSTATIQRAAKQVRYLFDRELCQFPPPGLDATDSGFAVLDESSPGRLYVGITTAGRSSKFTLQAVAGSVFQSAGSKGQFSDSERDGYATGLMYFNSLRELGGAVVQVLDDIPDSIELYAKKRGESSRDLQNKPSELTSRVSAEEVVRVLNDLSLSCDDPDAIDAVLATNMVSVGVDVPRLGLMLVQGQPKTRSEYIQSTSRVGRGDYPGLVLTVLNAAKARDRSSYENFESWHQAIYREVEATSVTPFAPRARDKTLGAILLNMLRYSSSNMFESAKFTNISPVQIAKVTDEIRRRVHALSPEYDDAVSREIELLIEDWEYRNPSQYTIDRNSSDSLIQRAEDVAKVAAMGIMADERWPILGSMRNVEPNSQFRFVDRLSRTLGSSHAVEGRSHD